MLFFLVFTCSRNDLPFSGFLIMASTYSSSKRSSGLQVGFEASGLGFRGFGQSEQVLVQQALINSLASLGYEGLGFAFSRLGLHGSCFQ